MIFSHMTHPNRHCASPLSVEIRSGDTTDIQVRPLWMAAE